MDIVLIAVAGIVGVAVTILLKQYKPEYAMMTALITGIVILTSVIRQITPILDEVNTILSSAKLPGESIGILFKALGICFLTQLAVDLCKDAGESAIANKIEIAGKISVVVLSLPLFTQILGIAASLIAM